MNKLETKSDKQMAVELALSEILNYEHFNTWVSVKERSIVGILAEAGLHKGYSPYVMEGLKKVGLIEVEGARAGLKYKISSNTYPDIPKLAKKILKIKADSEMSYRTSASEGYPPSKRSDLRPKVHLNELDNLLQKVYSGKPIEVPSKLRKVELPILGDTRYLIFESNIYEGKVVSMWYTQSDSKEIGMKLRIKKDNKLVDIPRTLLTVYATIEDLLSDLIKNIQKI